MQHTVHNTVLNNDLHYLFFLGYFFLKIFTNIFKNSAMEGKCFMHNYIDDFLHEKLYPNNDLFPKKTMLYHNSYL